MVRYSTLSQSRLHLIALLAATSVALSACGSGAEGSGDRGTGGAGGTAGAGGGGGQAGAGGEGGSVASSAVSIVFVHGENLYGALAEHPGETRRLSDVEGSEDQLDEFRVSPDGRFVAYLASRRDPSCCRQELMVASLDGVAEPTRVDDAQGDVEQDFTWSPDGLRLAYRADEDPESLPGDQQIFTVGTDGGDRTRVSGEGIDVPHQPSFAIEWSPQGSRIAYLGYQRSLLRNVLATNAWRGDSAREIAEGRALAFAWRPDGGMLAYTARNVDDAMALFTSDAMGESVNEIVAGLRSTGSPSFAWSPDGSRIAYLTENDQGVVELYSRAADGSDEQNMTGELKQFGVTDFAWNHDGSRILYYAWQDREDHEDLYTTEADGSNNTRISSRPDDRAISTYHWSPTGDWIAFTVDTIEERTPSSVFVSAGDGSARYKLNLSGREAALRHHVLGEIPWSPNGEYVAFFEGNEIGNGSLVTSRLDGAERHAVYDELEIRGRGVTDIQWSPDSERLAYRADRDGPNLYELYTANRDGSETQKVSIPGLQVEHGFQWVP
jgi:Tol biopolymer transport system component